MTVNRKLKIMYVDTSTDGHHLVYLNSLLQAASEESFAVLPEHEGEVEGRCIEISGLVLRTFSGYRAWMKSLKEIADREAPDAIHFLNGDSIMRYFGMGLGQFRKYKTVMTFHHLFPGKLREISMKSMLHQVGAGVFHTEVIKQTVGEYGCKNIHCIPYPCFLNTPIQPGQGYQNEPPVLLALGGTRHDKGLDILLEAMKFVNQPFRLIIAGKEEDIKKAEIERQIQTYRAQVELKLCFLTDKEVLGYLQKSDIIVLPYRKEFDGASGPMCEGIYLGKTIIGPNHGSLGQLIPRYHVGYTFESENVMKLAECLNHALKKARIYDETARKEQEELNPVLFQERYIGLYEKI